MSEPKADGDTPTPSDGVVDAGPPSADASGAIPVEVVPPDAPAEPEDPIKVLETKVAGLEKDKKDNWDRYLRAAADVENLRKRQKRELDDARFETKTKILKEV